MEAFPLTLSLLSLVTGSSTVLFEHRVCGFSPMISFQDTDEVPTLLDGLAEYERDDVCRVEFALHVVIITAVFLLLAVCWDL